MRAMSYCVGALLSIVAGATSGCALSEPEPVGEISLNLVGQAPSGAVFRLRDAVITVTGPTPTVWRSEDDPNQTSLSANVLTGSYSATLQDGWRLERVDGSSTSPVAAQLTSSNPLVFSVNDRQRTSVPMQFLAGADGVDMTQGYDIVIAVQQQPPPAVIAVVNNATPSITIYPSTAAGDVAPLRVISGPATTLASPNGVAIDGDQIIVVDAGAQAIDVFSLRGNGNVAPVRRIVGGATTLSSVFSVLVFNGEIYVGQGSSVLVFPVTANGNVAPSRTITRPLGQASVGGLVIAGGELFVAGISATIAVFPVTATDPATATRTMTLTATTSNKICPSSGIAFGVGNLFVTDQCAHGVLVVPADSHGNVNTSTRIQGSLTGMSSPQQVSVLRNELFVTDNGSTGVRVFPITAQGDVAPVRTISGSHTGLANPVAVSAL